MKRADRIRMYTPDPDKSLCQVCTERQLARGVERRCAGPIESLADGKRRLAQERASNPEQSDTVYILVPRVDAAKSIELLKELAGELCQCGARKRTGQTFCGPCYRSLDKPMQANLYQRLGSGYREAYQAAMEFLARW